MKQHVLSIVGLAPLALTVILGTAASAANAKVESVTPRFEAAPLIELPPEGEIEEPTTGELALAPPVPEDVPPHAAAAALPSLADDPPEGKSAPPTWKEWSRAAEIELTRSSVKCRATRVREWVRVRCDLAGETVAQMNLVAGSREGVSFGHNRLGPGYDVVFPVRRGDRRVFQMLYVAEWSKYSVGYDVAYAISEAWLPDAPAPTITVD